MEDFVSDDDFVPLSIRNGTAMDVWRRTKDFSDAAIRRAHAAESEADSLRARIKELEGTLELVKSDVWGLRVYMRGTHGINEAQVINDEIERALAGDRGEG